MFVKNMVIAVFGTAVLKSSSVTGTQSNRIKNKTKKEPRPKLDPAKLLAVRDTLRYWLTNEKGYDEVAIEFELQQVGTHISHKIYELNRVPSGKRAVHNHPDVTEDIETENDDSVAKYCETDASAEEDHDHDDPLEDRSEINSESAIEDEKKDEEHTV
ncbi:unnamed protein product [Lasius platythorax]|uniref:Uncharacterized protein n=1 Tax=Lasius platythorax TaxID=488582 RepID=A0AAV2NXW6_9HYME